MAKRTTKQNDKPVTTAQKLGSVVKSARDIMRTDKGLNGELDRLPQLTWIMFLKLLDDSEKLHEVEAELEGISYKLTIQPPYRWRDWAANENFTGDRLKSFINNDEAILPDGTKAAGLLAYLRNLKSKTGRDRADVIAKVFKDVTNRMISGTLLWDVLNKVNDIHFDKSEEVNLLSTLYESMLKEMRDAAGDSGEFYTPRPVVRFIVQVMEPKLGETIFDPACGTGGFLVEAYEYLKKNCSAQDWQILQKSIIGGEAKSLPLMLAHMSLLLHGFEYPDIDDGNSLRFTLSEMGEKDWVDVILTNDDKLATPILRMGNIQKGCLDLRDLKYLHLNDKERERLLLKKGDILVNRTNSAELVGKCAVFEIEGEYAFASYIIRLRLDQNKAEPRLVAAYINSPSGRAYMFSERKQMTGQANVNAQKLKAMPISLPSLSEQRRIVAYLDELQIKGDTMKRMRERAMKELDALLPSILDKAFKGEL
ncbi:N-6 DNA methylase [Nostoc sp.]|uniref:N-6 DNA methylase n=1 Tax=Nostoc sp. TaxID=1180 RepID=UPI002FFB50A3